MTTDTNTEKTIVDAEVTEVAETVESAEVPASLTVQDLANLRNIIDVASQRGAFKATEFSMVGDTYTKLNNFITAITPKAEGEAETEAPAEDAVAE